MNIKRTKQNNGSINAPSSARLIAWIFFVGVSRTVSELTKSTSRLSRYISFDLWRQRAAVKLTEEQQTFVNSATFYGMYLYLSWSFNLHVYIESHSFYNFKYVISLSPRINFNGKQNEEI